ncbi:serine hydrolase [Streptomyces tagetis]|uniref:Serine hydrolase n=1 Tax=Streptomyces tagetis TaxID=2820809 RepID=A0A941B2V0_9ACTN|nr:serine hydrolase [Streptomyces sp. RG38]MBQ0829780.1 serine hydrolase [Streptomyces sp. RG38]
MEPTRTGRGRRRVVPSAALAVAVALLGVTGAGTGYVTAPLSLATWPVSSSASGDTGGEAGVDGADGTAEAAVDHDALLAEAMTAVPVPDGAEVSVAVLDPDSGRAASYGAGPFETASIVKVDVLATLLLRAGDEGRELTGEETAQAAAMIEHSDNDATSALWRTIGGAQGLDAANARFGLRETTAGEDGLWGLTRTTARDQITLLRQVFVAKGSLLDADARAYVRTLMGRIAEGQRWGVSAAADGSAWALKNGWLRRSTTGLWVIDSVGRVTSGGREVLVAVLTRGGATREAGISLAEATARAAVGVVA